MSLDKLLGVPKCAAEELLGHVEREHTTVPEGLFGASRTTFMPWNYQVCLLHASASVGCIAALSPPSRSLMPQIKTTPCEEFNFAYLAPGDSALPAATLGTKDGEDLGPRLPRKREIDWRELGNPATLCALLNKCLRDLGLKYTLTVEEVRPDGPCCVCVNVDVRLEGARSPW